MRNLIPVIRMVVTSAMVRYLEREGKEPKPSKGPKSKQKQRKR